MIESSAAAADTAALYAFDAAAAADTAALLAFDAAAAADTAALHAFDAAADTAALQHCPFQLVQKNIHPLWLKCSTPLKASWLVAPERFQG